MKKRIAIVTGASAGMGKDLAMELLNIKNVDEIWLIARRKERLEVLAKESILACGKQVKAEYHHLFTPFKE